MTTIINNVLIIGGGFSGMVAAIEMRKLGIDVDLVEQDESWHPEGAGISLGTATLRALEHLNLYDDFRKVGFVSTGADLRTPTGHLITKIDGGAVEGSSLSGEGGILRPVLAKLLADKVMSLGTNIILGHSFDSFEQQDNHVQVTLTNGVTKAYDLVIGAEGLHSRLRTLLFPDAPKPAYVGQGVWRAVMPKPVNINQTRVWISDTAKIGVNPCSEQEMYMFITENRATHEHIAPSEWADIMAGLIRPFPDPTLQEMIEHLYADNARLDYRPLFNMILKVPWNKGRIVLIGDSVAATTPHLASGACIGIESAIVLADEIATKHSLDAAFEGFHKRRFDRCKMVVENSARLADIEMTHGDKREHGQLMNDSFKELAKAI